MKITLKPHLHIMVIIGLILSVQCNDEEVLKNMVLIKGGEFEMGDVFDEGNEDEKPVHEVRVNDFYLGRYEVTVGEFSEFVEKTSFKTNAEGKKHSDELQKLINELMPLLREREKNLKYL